MRFAFVLLSPDCVLSGNTGNALRFMAERGVRVIAHRWHCLSAAEVARLYASNRKARPSTAMDDCVDALFSLSASLCCLVTSAEGLQGEALHRLLLDLKGVSDPFKCRPDQLRRVLGATNKILNLVHTSDSAADSLAEGAIFFPEIGEQMDRGGAAGAESLWSHCPPQQVSISGFRTINEVKQRSVALVGRHDGTQALESALELERQLLESQPDQVAIFCQLQQILARQVRDAATVSSPHLRALMPRLISLSARTADTRHARLDGAATAIHMLEDLGVSISAWESLVLKVEERMVAPPSITILR
jgi:nucleoside diphosphate kinase